MTDLSARAGTPLGSSGDVVHLVVRVWLPDRPGALGQVASRIGALRGDVVAIDILERDGGRAVDELVVALPMPDGSGTPATGVVSAGSVDLVGLLATEITQVDGVAVEDVRVAPAERIDPSTAALELSVALGNLRPEQRAERLATGVHTLFEANWTSLFDLGSDLSIVELGEVPDRSWLRAFLGGSLHLSGSASSDPESFDRGPSDLAWAMFHRSPHADRQPSVDQRDAEPVRALVIGRASRPFHRRERHHLALLARLVPGF